MKSTTFRVTLFLALSSAALCMWLQIRNVNAQSQLRPGNLVWEKGVPATCTRVESRPPGALHCETVNAFDGILDGDRIVYEKKLDASGNWDGTSYLAFVHRPLDQRIESLEQRVDELEHRLSESKRGK